VVLTKSGITLDVPKGKTILETVLDAGVAAPHSCMEGVCGTCATPVLEGIPDHRDLVLSKQEKESNRTMMICCSGSRGPRLLLDL
jgi:vanillate O-demethylase ferredoxin subunit